jgi:hypothetical protein
MSIISATPHKFLSTGDFNIDVDAFTGSDTLQVISLLDLAH